MENYTQGPLWDLDLSSGNDDEHESAQDFRSQNAFKWFEVLMKNKNSIIRLWPDTKNYYQRLNHYMLIMEKLTVVNEISKSVKTNYEKAYNYKDNNG